VQIISAPDEFHTEDLFVDLKWITGRPLYLKCEGFNFAGSIKLKAAAEMLAAAERDGTLSEGSTIVESSSGNLGVALSSIAASRGYQFVCVTDARCNPTTIRAIESFGGRVHVVTEADPEIGLLGERLRYVRELCEQDERFVWLNQYTNDNNWIAHHRTTAPAIAKAFPQLDVVFVGAGTAGTLMGCARYFREHAPQVRIVAVDSVGSVTFGGPPGARHIPGLGAAITPPLLDVTYVDDVVRVSEMDTVRTCHRLARAGFLFGGSTGTVVSGALDWLAGHDPGGRLTCVAIAPDLGDRYLESIYRRSWLRETYGTTFDDEPALTDGGARRRSAFA
jgi:2,3-diaminopropionate biosynthesis protein SbnA